ncbi:MAG: hypothetical protein ACLFQK_10560, partial [Fibrobacterota bacterium]
MIYPPDTETTLHKLTEIYLHLKKEVPPEKSGTAAFLRKKNQKTATRRLGEESREMLEALSGDHKHPLDKTAGARKLLRENALSEDLADILLEMSQVFYWAEINNLLSPDPLCAGEIADIIKKGAASSFKTKQNTVDLSNKPVSFYFELIGR